MEEQERKEECRTSGMGLDASQHAARVVDIITLPRAAASGSKMTCSSTHSTRTCGCPVASSRATKGCGSAEDGADEWVLCACMRLLRAT